MKKNSTISILQQDITDCGAACLASIAAYYGCFMPVSVLRTEAGTNQNGTSLLGLVHAAEKLGFETAAVKIPGKNVQKKDLPAIAHLKVKDKWFHFVVIYSVSEDHYTIMDPASGKLESINRNVFNADWTTILLILKPGENFKQLKKTIPANERIRSVIIPHRSSLVKILLLAVIYSALGIATAFYINMLTDEIIPASDIPILNLLSVILTLSVILRIVTGLFKNLIMIRTSRKIDSKLINDYNLHLMDLPLNFFQKMKTGEIITRIADAIKIRSFVNSIVQELSVNLLIVIITIAVMIFYSPLLSLLVLSSIPFYFLLYRFLNKTNRKYLRETMENSAEMESRMVETIRGIHTIKAFNAEKLFIEKLSRNCKRLLASIFKTSRDYIFTSSGSEFLSSAGMLVMLWLGAYQVISGKMSYGDLFSFYVLYSYLSGPLTTLILSNRNIQDAKIAADRLFQVMDLMPEEINKDRIQQIDTHSVEIRFEDVSFCYPGKLELFKNVSLTCKPGTVNAITGESGCGKSTLLNLVLRFSDPVSGNIFFNERSIDEFTVKQIRSVISYVPQNVKLFSGTLLQNLTLSQSDPDWEKLAYWTGLTGLDRLIKKLPRGIHTIISEDGNNFSGGERQKIAITRAMYKDAAVILMDEPNASLDLRSERKFIDLIYRLKEQNKTIIIAAHKLSLIRDADQISLIRDRKISGSGFHSELIRGNNDYRELWEHQNN